MKIRENVEKIVKTVQICWVHKRRGFPLNFATKTETRRRKEVQIRDQPEYDALQFVTPCKLNTFVQSSGICCMRT